MEPTALTCWDDASNQLRYLARPRLLSDDVNEGKHSNSQLLSNVVRIKLIR